ncbi:MAG: DNA methylase [Limisphaerales bacterium]
MLGEIAQRHGLYLDFKRARAARGGQEKVAWQDGYGNKHDLDYVLERGGTEEKLGVPIAFVESAWRRYTKHSKNKAQEIEAAVMPIALTFSRHQPFCGAVLAGEFTRSAIHQLESKGFTVVHISYDSILAAFRELGIDASSEDGVGGTTEEQFRDKIIRWQSLPQPQSTDLLLAKLRGLHQMEIAIFQQSLEAALTRQVASVRLTILRGQTVECLDVDSAVAYLLEEEKSYRLREGGEQREAFEVQIRFNNESKIEATFLKRAEAIAFLRTFA